MTNMTDEPAMIELWAKDGSKILIWANGEIKGFDGIIVNRTPQLIHRIIDEIAKGVVGFGEDIKGMKDIIK